MKKHFLLAFVLTISFALSGCWSSRKTTEQDIPTEESAAVEPVLAEPAIYRGSDPISHNLIHTKLEVAFDWPKMELMGKAEITLKPHFYPQKMLYLDARGMQINSVKLIRSNSKQDLAFEYRNDSICITMDRIYSSRDTFKIQVDYIARPESLPKGGSDAIASDKGLYFINADGSDPKKPRQIWTQGETQSSSVWFPTIDRPNQKTTQETYITVDTAFVTLSNGKLISSVVDPSKGQRTDYWKQTLPHTPYLFMMAIGKYAVVREQWRGKEVSYYVEPEFAPYAKGIFNHTPEMLEFFSGTFGVEYPWEKYAQVVVRDFVSGAMENTTASIFGEFVQKDDRGLYDDSNDDIVAHELSHHWFGNLVTCESWSNLPLNESFATYSEYLWNEHKYGRDHADWALNSDLKSYLQEARTKQVNLIRFEYDDKEDMFDRHSYQKGGRILHMLRKAVGDEAFFAALKRYLEDNSYTAGEVHHLRLAFESVTGQDMNWFFNQWFLDKGHPVLEINYDYNAETGIQTVTVSQKQDLASTPVYRLPVEIDLYTTAGVKRHSVVVDKVSQTFEFKSAEKPLLVNFDADKSVLCTKTDNHTDEEFAYMFRKAPLLMDRMEGLSKLAKDVRSGSVQEAVVTEALNDAYWGIRSMALKSSKPIAGLVKSKLLELASSDPHPTVRSDAFDLLMVVFPKDPAVVEMANRAVGEKSYRVMNAAMAYILDADKSRGVAMLKDWENQNNPSVQSMVSGFYVKYGSDAEYAYMANHMGNTQGFDTYGAVQSFGKFLLRCSYDNAKAGVKVIGDIAYKHPQWFVRLAASQALAEIFKSYGKDNYGQGGEGDSKIDEVRSIAFATLEDVKSKETDPNLLRFYSR